jgi:WD40 repeat protein
LFVPSVRNEGGRATPTELKGHGGTVTAASFSPDSRHIVTASVDTTARVWDISGDEPTAIVINGHSQPVSAAVFSPDGLRVLTASQDATARVWDLIGERPTATVLDGHRRAIVAAAFSRDGQRVITASDDGTARIWPTYPDEVELALIIRARLSRCLSQAQREEFGLSTLTQAADRDFISPPSATGNCSP